MNSEYYKMDSVIRQTPELELKWTGQEEAQNKLGRKSEQVLSIINTELSFEYNNFDVLSWLSILSLLPWLGSDDKPSCMARSTAAAATDACDAMAFRMWRCQLWCSLTDWHWYWRTVDLFFWGTSSSQILECRGALLGVLHPRVVPQHRQGSTGTRQPQETPSRQQLDRACAVYVFSGL